MFWMEAPPPPPQPAAQERLLTQDRAASAVSSAERRLTLQRGPASEAMVVRYQVVLTRNLRRIAQPIADAERQLCRWEMTAYLQRDVCFTSLSGMTGCTEASSIPLPVSESGEAEIALDDPGEDVCGARLPLAQAAEARAAEQLRVGAAAVIETDFRTRVRPGLVKSGATVTTSR